MKWNVYRYNINSDKIENFNIFDHGSFNQYVQKHLKKCTSKEEFAEKIKSELLFYFWSKSQWELIVEIQDEHIYLLPWCGCKEPDKVKIDVSDENFDWKGFAEHHINRQRYKTKAKIDVYEQVMYRWEDFLEHVYEFK